jgi:flagellar FliL protein
VAKDKGKEAEAPAEGEGAAEGADGAAPGKKKLPMKMVIIGGVAAVLVLGGGGAGAFMFLKPKPAAEAGAHGEDAHGEKAGKPKKPKKAKGDHGGGDKPEAGAATVKEGPDGVVFYTLPDIVVNMQTADGRATFLKLKLTFELPDHEIVEVLNQENAPAEDAGGAPGGDWEAPSGADDALIGSERILNQDEIDSLLGFDLTDDDAAERTGMRAIINSALVSYERLPMLEIVFDRLVRLMTTSLAQFHVRQCRSQPGFHHLDPFRRLSQLHPPARDPGGVSCRGTGQLRPVHRRFQPDLFDRRRAAGRPPRHQRPCASRAVPTPPSSAPWSSA